MVIPIPLTTAPLSFGEYDSKIECLMCHPSRRWSGSTPRASSCWIRSNGRSWRQPRRDSELSWRVRKIPSYRSYRRLTPRLVLNNTHVALVAHVRCSYSLLRLLLTTPTFQEVREKKNKLQAELQARVDLTPEEAAKLAGTDSSAKLLLHVTICSSAKLLSHVTNNMFLRKVITSYSYYRGAREGPG